MQAKPGGAHQTRRDQQDQQILSHFGGDPGEGQAVGDDGSVPSSRLANPGYRRLYLEGALVSLETDPKRNAGREALRQFHTRTPTTQVPGPACLVATGMGSFSLEQDG